MCFIFVAIEYFDKWVEAELFIKIEVVERSQVCEEEYFIQILVTKSSIDG